MANSNFSKKDKARVEYFLDLFAKERKDIRKEIASVLPSYNELLEMHALTFEQFALQIEAEERGIDFTDPLFSYESIMPTCPTCKKHENTRRKQGNLFFCNACKSKFAANHDSISTGTKCSSVTWLKVLHSIMNFSTLEETCRAADISPMTFYNIRNRLFYGMQILMEDIKLYDIVYCDFSFARVSYKGLDLYDPDYPDDSPLFEKDYKPRESRKRGAPNKFDEIAMNSISIFTAIDSSSHVYTQVAGFGKATSGRLMKAVGSDRIMLTVPKEDPSPFHINSDKKSVAKPGSKSLLVSDKDPTIISFAKRYGIPHEYHVYRKKGVQMKLPKGAHDIQAVNMLDSKLKKFLRETNYVSTKYLPGFLVLFDFIQNTQGSQEAITQLFRILSKPGLGKDADFYENQYVVPNYMMQWLASEQPFKKLKSNQMYCYYLYRKRLDAIAAGEKDVQSVAEIADACAMSPSTVRRTYKNLESSGFGPEIMDLYEKGGRNRKKKKKKAPREFDRDYLQMYDEFCENLRKRSYYRKTFSAFVRDYNLRNGTNYTTSKVNYYFEEMEEAGVRSGRKELMEENEKEKY